jgi:hypothetical protein
MYCPEKEKNIICYRNNLRDTLKKTLAESVDLTVFDDSLHYQFRDGFLVLYQTGLKYIRNYYLLSKVLQQKAIPDTLLLQTQSALIHVNRSIQVLTHNNGIVIPDSIAEIYKALIKAYKPLSNDSVYQRILLDLENDIQRFTGLSSNLVLPQL